MKFYELIYVMNEFLKLYKESNPLEEPLLRPVMDAFMRLRNILHLPYVEIDEIIAQFLVPSDDIALSDLIKKMNGDSS